VIRVLYFPDFRDNEESAISAEQLNVHDIMGKNQALGNYSVLIKLKETQSRLIQIARILWLNFPPFK